MTRREARESALCVLFAYGYTPEKPAAELTDELSREFEREGDKYVSAVTVGVSEHHEALDALIAECAVGWSLSRISRISMAILRLACYEMLYMPDIPLRVTINEAVELSKKYDDEKAYSFVNGVLNRASRSDAVLAVSRD